MPNDGLFEGGEQFMPSEFENVTLVKGDKGDKGDRGETGPQGPKGDPG